MRANHDEHGAVLPESGMMRGGQHCSSSSPAGFTLIELLVVLAVVMVIASFAIPTMTTAMDGIRLRGALGSASNIAQRSRIQAIKRNVYQRLHFSAACGQVVVFVTDGTDAAACPAVAGNSLSSQVWFPSQFSILPGLPTGAGAPPALTTVQMWGTAGVFLHANPDDPYFNSRGLPCWPGAGAVCSSNGGFVYYYRYQNAGHTRWAATSISPAGRIESWLWNGTSWGN
jgi:prepilin-type N-terminal cleavage/methylation domain-containing protein